MKFTCRCLFEVILLIVVNLSNGSVYSRSEMCSSERYEVEDCSFQLSSSERKICNIHKPAECHNNDINLTVLPLKLLSEKNAKFSVSIQPYTAEENALHLSAVNISIRFHLKEIKQFLVTIEVDDSLNTYLCRLIDFQNFTKEISTPITLFYDCFYNMVEWNIQNVKISFASLPLNNELSYFLHIPPVMTYDSECRWQIAIMVFCNSLMKGIVQVKFLPSPEYINISLYSVKLIEASSNKVASHNIASLTKEDMIRVVFSSVKEGYHYVSVQPKMDNMSHCLPANTAKFYVKIYSVDKMLIVCVCIILLFTFSFFSALKCFKTYKYPDLQPKQALLVHSFDCPEHESFISTFAAYLTKECKLRVNTMYGRAESALKLTSDTRINTKDPKQWLRDKYKEADVIIFMISEGLCITLGKDETVYVKEGTHWRQQLPSIKSYISIQLFNSNKRPIKKFCKIIFPYSNKEQIPLCLNDMGPSFKLPKDFNKFLCFVFGCKSWFSFINFNPKLSGSCPLASPDGRELLEKVKLVQTAVANKTHITIIKKDKNVKKASTDDTCSESECGDCVLSFKSMNNIESMENDDSEICDIDSVHGSCNYEKILLKEWQNIFKNVHKNYNRLSENNPIEKLIQEEFKIV